MLRAIFVIAIIFVGGIVSLTSSFHALLFYLWIAYFRPEYWVWDAAFLQSITISTMNFQSFAELAFSFDLTLPIVIKVLLFSLLMGFLGGFLPAFRAAKLNIVSALRSA